jgi:dGTPase
VASSHGGHEPHQQAGSAQAALVVCDYIAGMTDRFALEEHRRMTDPDISG